MAPEKAGREAADLIATARSPRVCDVPQPVAHGKQFRPREALLRGCGLGCPGPRAFQPGHILMQPRRLGGDVAFSAGLGLVWSPVRAITARRVGWLVARRWGSGVTALGAALPRPSVRMELPR